MKKLYTLKEAQKKTGLHQVDLRLNVDLGIIKAYKLTSTGRLAHAGRATGTDALLDLDGVNPRTLESLTDEWQNERNKK